ncbi:MAG: xanthine dehydrogenase small subunit [Ramlibacter sp.]
MEGRTIRFIRRGELVALSNVPPTRTLLELLREDLASTGTKEGCGEGGCGACTVVLGELEGPGDAPRIRYRAINACIRLAHSIDGLALWTVEDLAGPQGALHPAQEAMLRSHGSQCGFCTPGFVMSLFGMYQNHVRRGQPVTRELAQQELSGNLCRCTGYRPILDAAQAMAQLPAVAVDEAALVAQLQLLQREASSDAAYMAPASLDGLLAARARHPHAQLVAGCTDVGLWVTKMHREFAQVLDVTRAAELRRVDTHADHLHIGAAVTLADAFAALVAERPQLATFAARFAGLPVRHSGTLGGNIANGSPIGDSMPLLIALRASIVLASTRGEREMPLEDFYTGYRQTVLAPDEVLAWIKVPRAQDPHPHPLPQAGEGVTSSPSPAGGGSGWGLLRAYKISKRYDDDISAVCLVIDLRLDGRGAVADISIGAGGVAATPARARRTENLLRGQPWTESAVQQAATMLRQEFQPISDMRASAAYRSQLLGNLMRRFWLETQGAEHINLERAIPELAPQAAGSAA